MCWANAIHATEIEREFDSFRERKSYKRGRNRDQIQSNSQKQKPLSIVSAYCAHYSSSLSLWSLQQNRLVSVSVCVCVICPHDYIRSGVSSENELVPVSHFDLDLLGSNQTWEQDNIRTGMDRPGTQLISNNEKTAPKQIYLAVCSNQRICNVIWFVLVSVTTYWYRRWT